MLSSEREEESETDRVVRVREEDSECERDDLKDDGEDATEECW